MPVDCVVIGAGPAGLSASAALQDRGIEHLVLERGRVGETWRSQRWDSFRLNTPGWMNAALGEQPRESYPSRAEMIVRLDELAATAPIRAPVEVTGLNRLPGQFAVLTNDEEFRTRTAVVATGDQNVPVIPPAGMALGDDVEQYHAADYRNPADLPPGRVLVVGSGQSGCQIAHELRTAGREVILSTCAAPRMPALYRGRETFEWLVSAGFFDQRPEDLADASIMSLAQPIINSAGRSLSLQSLSRDGVVLAGRLLNASERRLQFDESTLRNIEVGDTFATRFLSVSDDFIKRERIDAPEAEPDYTGGEISISPLRTLEPAAEGVTSVIWCTGFRGDFSWLDASLRDGAGRPRRIGLASSEPGLWFIGMKWLCRRSSGILLGFPGDASSVANAVAAQLRS